MNNWTWFGLHIYTYIVSNCMGYDLLRSSFHILAWRLAALMLGNGGIRFLDSVIGM